MRRFITLLGLAAPMLTACPVGPLAATVAPLAEPQAIADDLLAADRAFAAAAANRPAIDGLSAMFDDDVAMFVVPVAPLALGRAEALDVLRQAFGGDRSTVAWAPVRGGVSADGQHGFTYGFMTRTIDGKPPQQAKYLSYWIRRPAGWRVAAFKFIPRADGDVALALRPPALPAAIVPIDADPARLEQYRAGLDRAERQFSDDSQAIGIGKAFRQYGSADAMNVGGGTDFTYGNDAIADGQGGDASVGSPLRWAPDGVVVASSGDLGLTYGYLLRNGPTPPGRLARIPFFTVWRRASPDAPWRYVAE